MPAGFSAQEPARPNVILIYADDLGYGDVSSYGATRLKTPHIDRVAREGVRFTDAHAPAATCTPSRYALLTGEYAWRKPGTSVLPGNAALVIEPGRTTAASVFQKAGYATGVVGKWHLGLGPAGGPDWNGEIRPGPNDVGFDTSFIMAATGDRVPDCLHRQPTRRRARPGRSRSASATAIRSATGRPDGRSRRLLSVRPSHGHDQTIVNGISRIGYMTGGKAALWKDEDMADVFTGKAVSFIEQHRGKPFFLFFALHDPHVPRVPHPRFAGKTGLGPRGDVIAQADWSVGEILAALDRWKLDGSDARDRHERQRPRRRRRVSGRCGGEAGRSSTRGPVPRREVQQLRRRHARAVHRALAGAREARRVRCARVSGRSAGVVRGADGTEARSGRWAGQSGNLEHVPRRVEHRARPSRRTGRRPLASARAHGSTSSPATGRR